MIVYIIKDFYKFILFCISLIYNWKIQTFNLRQRVKFNIIYFIASAVLIATPANSYNPLSAKRTTHFSYNVLQD